MDFLMETRDLTKAWRKKTAVERVNLALWARTGREKAR